jgi:hypothetical protein
MTANAILMALRPEGKVMVVFSVCEGRNGATSKTSSSAVHALPGPVLCPGRRGERYY